MAENLGRCDNHSGPHPRYADFGFACVNWKPEPEGMAKNGDYMNFPQPALRIVKTVGGYFRVYIQGKDDLQDNQVYAVMDIGRGSTKDAALAQARDWFDSMEDDT